MELVEQTSALFSEIIDVIEKVVLQLAVITSSTREQSTGIDQINETISQLDEVSSRNAALTEELTATGKTLQSNAMALQELIEQFKIGEQDTVKITG